MRRWRAPMVSTGWRRPLDLGSRMCLGKQRGKKEAEWGRRTNGSSLSFFLFLFVSHNPEKARAIPGTMWDKEHGIALLRITMRRRSRRSHDNDTVLSWKRIFPRRAKYAVVVTVMISRLDRRYHRDALRV